MIPERLSALVFYYSGRPELLCHADPVYFVLVMWFGGLTALLEVSGAGIQEFLPIHCCVEIAAVEASLDSHALVAYSLVEMDRPGVLCEDMENHPDASEAAHP